jgi:hypothetical protein
MRDGLPGSGRGHYTNFRDDQRLLGFLEVQVQQEDDQILVHETFVTSDPDKADYGAQRVYGFVWRRI